jgi:hypothetical protein
MSKHTLGNILAAVAPSVRMEIICQSQCRNKPSATYLLQLRQPFGWKSFVSPNVETHGIIDVRATIKPVAPTVHCRSDGNHLSVTISKQPSSEIDNILAAIESVAPSMHFSFGWKSFVSHNVKAHPLLKSATYKLQSNQLRQPCIVVRMEIICQSQFRNNPLLKSTTYLLPSNQLRQACIFRSDGNHLLVTMSKHILF